MITEGEKKAAKAVQEGIACIAIQGVWSAFDPGHRAAEKAQGKPTSEETAPIPGLLEIARRYDRVPVLGDSDLLTNPQARAGLDTLAKSLVHRDIRAVVAYCPPAIGYSANGERSTKKQGLDDWLVADRFQAIRSLPALAFAAEVASSGITDVFNAHMIARQSRKSLAYSRGGWFVWNGFIWETDNVGHRRNFASKVAASYNAYADKLDKLVRKVTGPFGKKTNDWPDEVQAWSAPLKATIKVAKDGAERMREPSRRGCGVHHRAKLSAGTGQRLGP